MGLLGHPAVVTKLQYKLRSPNPKFSRKLKFDMIEEGTTGKPINKNRILGGTDFSCPHEKV